MDKPVGPTSHDVVARVRRTLGERRVGHTGTLDPFASGLLVLCVGTATRLAEYLTALDKTYEARVRLGARTPTHDTESEPVAGSDAWTTLAPADVESALAAFRGTIEQRPPEYSAKKVGGRPAHRLARAGETVDLPPREVTVHALSVLEMDLPDLVLRVTCSSGTYVRALARDLGEALGVGGYLTELRRTRVGLFRVEDAAPPAALDDPEALRSALLPPASALAHLRSVSLHPDEAARLVQGQSVAAPSADTERPGQVAVFSGDELVAVASAEGGRLRPRKVFVEPARS